MSKQFSELKHLMKHLIILAFVCVVFLGPMLAVTAKDKVMQNLPTFNCDKEFKHGFTYGVRWVTKDIFSTGAQDVIAGLVNDPDWDRYCYFRFKDGVKGRIEYPEFLRKETEDDRVSRNNGIDDREKFEH